MDTVYLRITSRGDSKEALTFVSDLVWMYVRFARNQGHLAGVMGGKPRALKGFSKVIVKVTAPGAQAILAREAGVHRMVRLSSFDPEHRRHTCFARVEVLASPLDPETEDILEGFPLRSYILHPYFMIKNHQDETFIEEEENVRSVLRGNLSRLP